MVALKAQLERGGSVGGKGPPSSAAASASTGAGTGSAMRCAVPPSWRPPAPTRPTANATWTPAPAAAAGVDVCDQMQNALRSCPHSIRVTTTTFQNHVRDALCGSNLLGLVRFNRFAGPA